MSGLKERIASKSAALIEREVVTLPKCGETVVVHGLMTGELSRVNATSEETRGVAVICLSTEDPDSPGQPIWNWNDANDRTAAGRLHVDDSALIINVHNRLSGLTATDADLLKNSDRTESSFGSSPSGTASSETN